MTDYSKITDEQIMDTLRTVVAERPDFVYERPQHADSCMYVHGTQPGCVVGTVLHRLGVPLDELREYEGDDARAVMVSLGIGTYEAQSALRGAQIVQDSAVDDFTMERAERGETAHPTWGAALAAAERFLTDYS